MKKALKRSLSLLLAITIIFSSAYVGFSEVDFDSLFAVRAKAASVSDLIFRSNFFDVGYAVVGCNESASGSLVIPSTYNGEPVTSIDYNAFCDCSKLTSITIPNSVKTIGFFAFYGCTNLVSVTIPNSITDISLGAFYNCTSLTSVTIPKSVTSIGEGAFGQCTALTSINVDENNKDFCSVDGVLFNKNKTILKQYPAKKTNASYSIFSSVTSIESGAFYCCTNLTSITIPGTVTRIGNNAFTNTGYYNSTSNWKNGVLYIGNHLIEAKDTLSGNYTIKSSTKTIADSAFSNCTNLATITIPDSVTSIGNEAFRDCTSLTSITIPDSVTSIGGNAFTNTGYYNSSSNWQSNVLYIGNHLIEARDSSSESYAIKNGTKTIAAKAFEYYMNLTSVTIPDSVINIGDTAFGFCGQLKYVYYTGSETQRNKISIGKYNDWLFNAKWYYNYDPNKPITPEAITTNEIGGIKVSWNNISGATKYVVFRRQAGSSSWVNIGTTTGTTLFDKNVKSGVYYCYSVRAYNSKGQYSLYIPSLTSTRKFMATPKLTGISNSTNGLYIKWNAVAGITNGYRVYRRGAGQTTWTYLGTTKNLYFTDSKVKNNNGEYFRYTVIADGGYHSKFDTTGLYLKRLSNPSLKSATFESNGVVVKWGSVKGSTGYYVYRKTATSNWERIAIVGGANTTSYIDRSAKKGITYTYTVRAYSGSTLSYFYSGISCYDKY